MHQALPAFDPQDHGGKKISLLPKIQIYVEALGLLSHNPSPQKAEVGSLQLKASLGCIVRPFLHTT